MCLDAKQIDNTTKTLLALKARCVGEQIKLQETKINPGTHVSYAQCGKTYSHL